MAAADGSDFTPAGPIEVARLLLAAGADVNHLAPHPLYKRASTALHVAASGDNTAMLRFLLERGADPTVADGQGQTPKQALQATVVNARESGMLDDEDLDQMVQGQAEAVRLLEEAERGTPPGDWRPAAEAAEAKAAALRSQLAVAFDGLKRAFTAEAVEAISTTVKLEPAARARWADAAARDALAGPLRAPGFKTRVGVFRLSIAAAGEVLVLALLDRRRNAYAAVYEHAGRHWADLVRWHGDGSMLTVTNAPTIPAAEADLSAFRKVRRKRADAAALVAALDAEAPPAEVAKLTPDAFAARFETVYAEETAARRAGA